MRISLCQVDVHVGIFCHNEQKSIADCIQAVAKAIGSRSGLISVFANGSTDDSEAIILSTAKTVSVPIEVYIIGHGDKSNAINTFIYDIRVCAKTTIFVDGYTKVSEDAFDKLIESQRQNVTSVNGSCLNGRNESKNVTATIRGQLFTISSEFLDRMVAAKVKLPINLYRGDGLLGSMVAHNLDATTDFDRSCMVQSTEAKFSVKTINPFSFNDLKRYLTRRIRQNRGRLENLSIKSVIYTGGYEALPEFADDMISAFLTENKVPAVSLLDRPFMWLALWKHRLAVHPSSRSLQAIKVYERLSPANHPRPI